MIVNLYFKCYLLSIWPLFSNFKYIRVSMAQFWKPSTSASLNNEVKHVMAPGIANTSAVNLVYNNAN